MNYLTRSSLTAIIRDADDRISDAADMFHAGEISRDECEALQAAAAGMRENAYFMLATI